MQFLFVDRIHQLELGKYIKGNKQIFASTAYLSRDHQGIPSFMPTLIGETVGQLAAWNVMAYHQFKKRPVAGVVANTHITRSAYIGETIALEVLIEHVDDTAVQYQGIASIEGQIILKVEGAIGPLLPMEDFIGTEEVRKQFNQLLQPQKDFSLPVSASATESHDAVDAVNSNNYLPPLHFDRFISINPGSSITAELTVPVTADYFADHFPKKPVLPMTILLAYKLELARKLMETSDWADHYQAKEFRKIKMNAFVYPGETLQCEVKFKQQTAQGCILSFHSTVNKKRVCVAELLLVLKPTLASSTISTSTNNLQSYYCSINNTVSEKV